LDETNQSPIIVVARCATEQRGNNTAPESNPLLVRELCTHTRTHQQQHTDIDTGERKKQFIFLEFTTPHSMEKPTPCTHFFLLEFCDPSSEE
jgi:hypothetical protein